MRFLGVGENCDLGDMYYRLGLAGHEVRVHIGAAAAQDVYGGMLRLAPNWRAELAWIREAGAEGIIIFESASMGEIQNALRHDGYQVIGGSAFGDRLEDDREFGQKILRDIGLNTARSWSFTDFDAAIAFIHATPGRYVFKLNDAEALRTRNYIGEMDDGADMLALLKMQRAQWHNNSAPDFVLMQYVSGTEVGIGAYFNGQVFLQPVCLDWEHKRLFPGNLGELTGEMGTIVTYRGGERIFALTLARMQESLRASAYCGYINLSLMANEHGLWPLEFTSRFGYPGFAICQALHGEPWDVIFRKMLQGQELAFPTHAGFAAGIVLSVPPFPYSFGYEQLSKGVPVLFRDGMTPADHAHVHFAEVALRGSQLVTSGNTGYIGTVTGTGDTVEQAQDIAYERARKVVVPNLRYRNDIGAEVMQSLAQLKMLGLVAE